MSQRSVRFMVRVADVWLILCLAVIQYAPLSFITASFAEAASVPTIVSYQGRLTDASGNLLGGSGTSFFFKFSIWDASATTSGSRLWPTSAPTATTLNVRQGVFSANIGDTAGGYPDALNYAFDNPSVYLQVEVSSDGATYETLSPRHLISSSAFSQVSGSVRGSGQSAIGTTTPVSTAVLTVEATTSSAVPLSIRAASGQSANLFNILNAGGTSLFSVTSAGALALSGLSTGDILYQSAGGILTRLPIGSGSQVLKISGGIPAWGADATGGGGAGAFSTSSDDLSIYPTDTNDVVILGSSATSTTGNIFEVLGNSLFRGAVIAYDAITGTRFVATSTTASVFPYASTTALSVSGTGYFGSASTTNLTISSAAGGVLKTNSSGAVTIATLGSDYLSAASSIEDLSDVVAMTENYGDLLYWNGSSWADFATSSLAVSTTDIIEGNKLFYTTARVQTYLDSLEKGYYFSTTSAIYLSSTGQTFSTTSASYFALTGSAFSTTSVDAWKNTRDFFSTTSSLYLASTGQTFSTTSSDYWKSVRDFFSTTSTQYFVSSSSTIPKTYTANVFSALQQFSSASTTILSVANGSATTTLLATATSTFGAGLQASALNITSTTATSTFSNGLSLSSGCFSVGGNCLTYSALGGFAYPFISNATTTILTFSGGIIAASSTINGNLVVTGNATATNATTTQFAISSVPSTILTTNANGSVVATTSISTNFLTAIEKGFFFSTTSTDYYKSVTDFFSTTSVAYYKSVTDFFSTTSAAYFASTGQGFSTTSALYLASTGQTFSTTSAAYFASIGAAFSTTSANYFVSSSTTIPKTYTGNVFSALQQFSNASTSILSVANGSATTTLLATATSTFAAGLQTTALNVTSSTASSTFANGLILTGGCISVGGNCITAGASSFAYPFTNDATSTLLSFAGGLISASSTINGNLVVTGNSTTTNATTTQFAIVGLSNALLSTNANGSVIAISSLSSGYLTNIEKGFFFSTTSTNFLLATGAGFSTTSSDYWKSVNDFFSTTSVAYYRSVTDFFSTTSANYFASTGAAFSTTSVDAWKSVRDFFSTTSALYLASTGQTFSTTSANYFVSSSSTIPKTYTANVFSALQQFSNASTSILSVANGSATTTLLATATSTFGAGLQTTALNITSTTATSTFANGIKLTGGCIETIGGTCLGGSAVSTLDSLTDVDTSGVAYGGLIFYNGTSWEDVATSSLAINTNNLIEGNSNLFYTDARVNSFIHASTTIPKAYTANSFSALQSFVNASTTLFSNSGTAFFGASSNSAFLSDGSLGVGTTTPYSRLTSWGSGTLFEAVTIASTTIFRVGQNGATTTNLAISSLNCSGATQLLQTDASGNVICGVDDSSGGASGLFSTTTGDLAIYPTDPNDVIIIGTVATSTTGNIFEVLGNSLFRGAATAYNTITAPIFTSTSTGATSTLPLLAASALSIGGDYITDFVGTGLSISGSTLIASLGTTVDLASEVVGLLPTTSGGTGWGAIQANTLLLGNGTGALATTTAGVNGQILALVGGTPVWVSTSTLATITGTLSVTKGGTGITSTPTYGQLLIGNASGTYDLAATSTLNINTDNLVEGNTNRFYTDARVQTYLNGVEKGFFFSTTSAAYFASTGAAFSTTSANYLLSTGAGFSTTSSDYWKTARDFFSTTSALYLASTGQTFSTTSAAYFTSTGQGFSTTSANYFVSSSTTVPKTYTANVFTALQQFGNASTSILSVANGSATTTLLATATSTFGAGVQTSALNVTGSATSTFTNGISLSGGCFRDVNGNCLTNSSISTLDSLTDVDTTGVAFGGLIQYNGSSWVDVATSSLALSTTDIIEGSKLFYTDSRVQTYLNGVEKGFFFSTTSADHWKTANNFFSTTSANYYKSVNDFFSTTSVQYFVDASSTIPKTYAANTFTALQTLSIGLVLSGLNGPLDARNGVVGATTTVGLLYGGTGASNATDARTNLGAAASGANTDITSLNNVSLLGQTTVATASSTALSALDYFAVGRTSTSTIRGSATSTFAAGVQTTALNVTSSSATSTFANGIKLTGGCIETVGGTCLGGSAVSTLDSLTDVDTTGVAYGGLIFFNGTSWEDVATSSLALSTTDILEGNKLFFTNARVQTYLDTLEKGYFFSTTSALYLASTGQTFSTTSSDYWKSVRDMFSTTSAQYFVHSSTTIPKTYTANVFTALQQFQNASTSILSVANGSATTTLLATATSTFGAGLQASALNITSTTATSTFGNGLSLSSGCFAYGGNCISAATLGASTFAYPFLGDATSTALTFSGGFTSSGNTTLAGATSTSLFSQIGSFNTARFGETGTSTFTTAGFLGIGTSSPYGMLSIHAASSTSLTQTLFTIASSSASATTTLFTIDNTGLITGGKFSLTNGTTTNLAITAISGALLSTNSNGSVTATTSISTNYLDTTGNWGGTFDGFEGSFYLANGFSTTSVAYYKSVTDFFSTTSAAYFASTGAAFSTTSADAWKQVRDFFSTTSALYLASTGQTFSTTSANYFVSSSSTIPKTYTANVFSALQQFSNASTSILSIANGSATTTLLATATSTFGAGLQASALNITSTTATSTFGNGLSLSSGCFAYGGNCISAATLGASTFAYPFPSAATSTMLTFDGGLIAASSTINGNLVVTGNATATNATTSSFAITNLSNALLSTNANGSVIATSSISTNYLSEGSNLFYTNGRVQTYLDTLEKGYYFSTTSALYLASTGQTFSTTSSDYWKSVRDMFSTTSAQYFVHSSTTIPKTYTANVFTALQQFQNASTSILSVANGSATTTLLATATSTFAAGVQTTALNVTSSTATSTFANGIALSGGCFRDANGNCLANSSISTLDSLTDVDTTGVTYGGLIFYNGTSWEDVATSSLALSTTDILEGSKLFYTNSRVQTYLDSLEKGYFFSTTSALYLASTGQTFATTSSDYWKQVRDFFSTTSAQYFAHSSTTIPKTYTANVFTALQQFGNASTTILSVANGSATTTLLSNATSTFGAGIQTTALNVTSTTATSTFANGLSLSGGCFAINNVCVGGAAGTNWDVIGNPGSDGAIAFGGTTQNIDANTNDITAITQDVLTLTMTNDAATDVLTQRLFVLENLAGANGIESFFVIDNQDTDDAVVTGIDFVSAAGGITTAIDLDSTNIGTGIALGANDITGSSAVINFDAFDVDASGNIVGLTIDTGQGANELFDMDQNVLTTSNVRFARASTTLFSNVGAAYFGGTATSTFSSTGALSLADSLTLAGSLNGPLQTNAGVVSATTSIGVLYGGTGLATAPSYGNILVGNASGGYTLTATSSLGLPTFGYLFPNNSTSTLLTFSGGLIAASSTVNGNLVITGNATATNATTTAFFSSIASSTNLFANTASIGTLTLQNALTAGNGGTGISTVSAAGVLLGNYTGTGWQQLATSSLAINTNNLIEGNTNLFYTDARTNAYIHASTTIPKTYTANVFTALQQFQNASTSLLSVANGTATTTLMSNATSTFGAGVQTTALNVTSTSASSTFANGLVLTGGCIQVGGSCIQSATFSYPFPSSATSSLVTFSGGLIAASSTVNGNLVITGNATATNATTTAFFSSIASSTNLFAQTGSIGSLTLGSALPVASGGTGLTTFGGANMILYTSSADNIVSNAGFTFNGTLFSTPHASTSRLSVFTNSYFGGTATTTIDSAGNVAVAGTLGVTGNTTLAGATSTSEFSQIGAFNTARFGQSATSSFSSAGALTLSTALTVANGGTGQATFSSGQLLYGNGTAALSSVATSSLATGTGLTVSAGTLGYQIGGSDAIIALDLTAANTWTGKQNFFGSASSTLFSANRAWFGATATTTIDSAGNVSIAGTLNASGLTTFANASTTILSAANGTATTTILATATSTFGAGVQATTLDVTSTTATSTFANGLILTGGCIQVGGSCIQSASFTYPFPSSATSSLLTFSGGLIAASSTINGNLVITGNATATNATTTSFFASIASSTNLYANTANVGTLSLQNALTAGNGGTGISTVSAAGVLLGNYAGTGWQQLATSSLAINTNNLIEGNSNLFYTDARVNSYIHASTTIPKTYTANVFSALQQFSNASTSILSIANGSATTTLLATATSTFGAGVEASALNITSSTASSTFGNGLSLSGGCFAYGGTCISATSLGASTFSYPFTNNATSTLLTFSGGLTTSNASTSILSVANGSATTTLLSNATSTFGAGIQTTALNVTSSTASSTFANGLVLTGGCILVGGNCISGGTGLTSYDAFTHPAAGQSATTSLMIFGSASTTIFSVATGNATTTLLASATSTFAAGVETIALNVTSTTATSTFANGIALTGGCFKDLSGSCIGSGSAFPFTPGTFGATQVNATGTALRLTAGLFASSTVRFGAGSDSEFFFNGTTGNLGLATSSPYAKLSVVGEVVARNFTATSTTATSTFAGGFNVGDGAITYDFSSGQTNIQNLAIGTMNFDTDAGIVSWTDMPVTSSAATSTVESYTAQIDGNPMLTLYSESNGFGGLIGTSTRVGIGTTTPFAKLSVHADGIGAGPALYIGSTTRSLFQVSATGTASTTGLVVSSAGGSVGCAQFNINGFLSNTGTACGSGSGGDPFTHPAAGQSATTSLMLLHGQASSTLFSANRVWFGATATTTIDAAGNVDVAGTLTVTGNSTTTNLFSTNLSANISRFGQTATSSFDSAGALTLASALGISSGGTGAGSFTTSGNAVYYTGSSLATAPLTSAVTTPYASSTALTVSGSAYFATSGGAVGIGTTTPQWLLNPMSASAPQLSLSAGAGLLQWTFRNAGGNLYFSTTTVAGTATTSSAALTIFGANGFVGIGTTSPFALLSVNAPAGVTPFAIGSTTKTLFKINTSGVTEIGDSSGTGDANFQFATDTNAWSIGYASTDKSFRIASSTNFASNVAFTITKGSTALNVGIGSTSPWRTLGVNGTVAFNGLGTNSTTTASSNLCIDSTTFEVTRSTVFVGCIGSSERFKHDISDLQVDALSIISQLRPTSYIYNNDPASTTTWGFVAEEAGRIDPHLVAQRDGVIYNIVDRSFLAVAISAIQDLDLRLEAVSTTSTSTLGIAVTLGTTTDATTTDAVLFGHGFFKNLFARVTAWFADAANGVGDFFAGKVHTKEICVGENGNETCLTKAQLDSLIANAATAANGGGGNTSPAPAPTPEPTPEPGPQATSTPQTTPAPESEEAPSAGGEPEQAPEPVAEPTVPVEPEPTLETEPAVETPPIEPVASEPPPATP